MNHNRLGETALAPVGSFTQGPHNRKRFMTTATLSRNGSYAATSALDSILRGRTQYFAEVVRITPEIAEEWLVFHNDRNRNLYDGRAEFYSIEMSNGYWKRASGAIGFDRTKQLTNGQHRLRAIVIANTPQDIPCVFNCDDDARAAEDCGKARSEADRLSLSGTEAQKAMVAIAKGFMNLPKSPARGTALEALRTTILTYRETLEAAISLCLNDSKGLRHSVIEACLARAMLHIGRERVTEFAAIARTGVAERKEDQAAARFYAWMRENVHFRGGGEMYRAQLYQYTSSALKAFAERRELKKIYAATEDLFPIPKA